MTKHVSALTRAITERTLVMQAQGVLMERHGYSERAALARMYVCAHKLGVDVSVVAAAVASWLVGSHERRS
jgi:AmiR/NasT family two-component response regulator